MGAGKDVMREVTAWQPEEIEGECGGGQTFQEVLKVVKMLKEDVCAIMVKQEWKKMVRR